MTEPTVQIASAVLALAFAWAAAAKLSSPRRWERSLDVYGLMPRARSAVAIAVPAAELAVVVMIAGMSARAGAAGALGLLGAFSLALMRARSIAGDRLPCGCFGATGERDWRVMIARNALLAAIAASVIATGSDVSLLDRVRAPTGGELVPATLVAAGLALAAWTVRSAATALRR